MRSRVRGESVTKRSMRGFSREALIATRVTKGWTPARLAREANLGVTTIRQWERGQRAPEPDNLAKVALALGVPMGRLIHPREPATLADLRTLAGLTQPQLGAMTGISTTSIGALERGEVQLSQGRAITLARALRTTIEDVRTAYEAARNRGDDVP